jgi:tetratricopeptide (TPR) repeat protein
MTLNFLGNSLKLRHIRPGSSKDIDLAITMYDKAVHHTPSDNLYRAINLNNLALALETRNGLNDLERAFKIYEESSKLSFAAPSARILAAVRAARLASEKRDNKAHQLYKLAVELLPLASVVCPGALRLWSEGMIILWYVKLVSKKTILK